MSKTTRTGLLGALLLLPGLTISLELTDFLKTEKNLSEKDSQQYLQLKSSSADSPPPPYLEYDELMRSDEKLLDEQTVSAFLERNAGSGPAYLLRSRWLGQLASQGRWDSYLKWYDDSDPSTLRKCHYLNALIQTGKGDETHSAVDEIWDYGRSRPAACDTVFKYWKTAGLLTRDRVWSRIDKAMNLGKTKIANHLRDYLEGSDRQRLTTFIKLRQSPERHLDEATGEHPWRGQMLGYGLKRLANESPEDAAGKWREIRQRTSFGDEERCIIEERLARGLYREPGDIVYAFFRSTGDCKSHSELHANRVKAALLREEWKQVLTWIGKMDDTMASEPGWRYWKARALEQTGRKSEAEALYAEVSADRSFYAYLASDRIGRSYRFAHKPAPVNETVKERIASDEGMQRIRELDRLGRQTEMRREWNLLLGRLDKEQMMAAAAVLHDWGILDRAIFTLAKSDYWDDMEIRFPVKHRTIVTNMAKNHELDASWAFGILRQESAFMRDAESSAGARGLMQLMPATARQVSRKFNLGSTSGSEILDPDKNIALGTGYLRMMLDKFDNNMTLATASYNAGPHRAKKWQYDRPLPADIWVELIPFNETRGYVKRVMTYASIYDRRLGKKKQRKISDRIGTIPARKG